MPFLERKHVAALLNRGAGTIASQGETSLRAVLSAAFQKHEISATLEFLPGAELGPAAARALKQALNRELDAVVVGGGDGSIQTVAGVLAGSGVPLGILPLGTMNHFAKDLGIPITMEDSITVIANGTARSVDLGQVNGQIFINNSSIGIYPYMVLERARERRRKQLSKWTAMILAGLRMLRYLEWSNYWSDAISSSLKILSFGNRCAGPSSQNQAGRAGERQRHMTGKSVGGRHRQQGTNRVKPRPSLNVTGIVRDVPTGSRRILMVVA